VFTCSKRTKPTVRLTSWGIKDYTLLGRSPHIEPGGGGLMKTRRAGRLILPESAVEIEKQSFGFCGQPGS